MEAIIKEFRIQLGDEEVYLTVDEAARLCGAMTKVKIEESGIAVWDDDFRISYDSRLGVLLINVA